MNINYFFFLFTSGLKTARWSSTSGKSARSGAASVRSLDTATYQARFRGFCGRNLDQGFDLPVKWWYASAIWARADDDRAALARGDDLRGRERQGSEVAVGSDWLPPDLRAERLRRVNEQGNAARRERRRELPQVPRGAAIVERHPDDAARPFGQERRDAI